MLTMRKAVTALALVTALVGLGCEAGGKDKDPATLATPPNIGQGGQIELTPTPEPIVHPQDIFDRPADKPWHPKVGQPEPQPKHDAAPVPLLTTKKFAGEPRLATFYVAERPTGVPLEIKWQAGAQRGTDIWTGSADQFYEHTVPVKSGDFLSMTVLIEGAYEIKRVTDLICMVHVGVGAAGTVLVDFDQTYGHVEPRPCQVLGRTP